MRTPLASPRASLLTCALTTALLGCGDGSGTSDTYVPGRLNLVSPVAGVTYEGSPPALFAALDPTLTEAERSELTLTVNGADATPSLVTTAGAASASGLSEHLRAGSNEVRLTLGDEVRSAAFTWACGDGCAPPKPVLTGPSEAVALSQATLRGEHLGGPTSRRVLYVDGEVGEWFGGSFSPTGFAFVAPPERDSVTVEVEVDGVRSDPLTITITAAPALSRPAADIVSDSVGGLHDLLGVMRALPVVTTGHAELDTATANLRAALSAEIERELILVDAQVAALPDEAEALVASFLEQGRLDELLPAWASDLAKADAPSPEYGACGRDLLRVYRLVSYFAVVHDALSGLALTAAFVAVLVPPFAAVAVAISELAAGIATVISNLQLFISVTMPSVEGIAMTVPAVVERAGEGTVTATVTWAWDPARKAEAVASWAAHGVMGKVLSDNITALGELGDVGEGVVRLTDEIYAQVHAFSNAAASAGADGGASETWTAPADPTYLGFSAEYFELSPATGPGACEAVGRWAEDAPCQVSDRWTAGAALAPKGVYDVVFAEPLVAGTVATTDDTIEAYDDPLYGAWLENFAEGHGCDELTRCWEVLQESPGCNPGLGDFACNEMSLGGCPTENDVMIAHELCVLCQGE